MTSFKGQWNKDYLREICVGITEVKTSVSSLGASQGQTIAKQESGGGHFSWGLKDFHGTRGDSSCTTWFLCQGSVLGTFDLLMWHSYCCLCLFLRLQGFLIPLPESKGDPELRSPGQALENPFRYQFSSTWAKSVTWPTFNHHGEYLVLLWGQFQDLCSILSTFSD